jgi:hypothetical protein
MSFAEAEAALGNAIEAENAPAVPEQATPTPATPEGTATEAGVQPHHAASQLRDPASGKFILPDGSLSDAPAPAADTPLFDGSVNPDQLIAEHPELAPFVKQLQGEWTRKTQALAEQRKQFDGLDPQVARQATELYQALQDPKYLQEFHAELSTHLQAQGLTSAQANTEAAKRIETEVAGAQGEAPALDLTALRSDPELAPIAAALEAQQSRLDSFEQQAQAREEAEAMANWQMAVAGELQRQEMSILQANPHYTEADMDGIHELAAYFDGNLLQAQTRYEQIGQQLVDRWLAQKQAHTEVTPGSVSGTGISEVPESLGEDLDAGLKAALGALAEQGIDTLDGF